MGRRGNRDIREGCCKKGFSYCEQRRILRRADSQDSLFSCGRHKIGKLLTHSIRTFLRNTDNSVKITSLGVTNRGAILPPLTPCPAMWRRYWRHSCIPRLRWFAIPRLTLSKGRGPRNPSMHWNIWSASISPVCGLNGNFHSTRWLAPRACHAQCWRRSSRRAACRRSRCCVRSRRR